MAQSRIMQHVKKFNVKIPVILVTPKVERQYGTVPKHVCMHIAVFVKIGMQTVKEDWHETSKRKGTGGGGRDRKRERKKGEGGTERERKERVMETVIDSMPTNGFNYSRIQPTFPLTPSFCL